MEHYVSLRVNTRLSKWCTKEKNKIYEGLAQHWPVHINHTLRFVQPYVHVFSNAALQTTCSFLLTEISSKSSSFTKCWPRCLNPNAAKASQSQKTHAAISDAYMHPSHTGLFTRLSLCNVLLFECPVNSPIIFCTWVILKLSNSLPQLADGHLYSSWVILYLN